MATTTTGPIQSPISVFTDIGAYRTWRAEQRTAGVRVGYVPTMGALHAGHTDLVRASLAANDKTVVTIFVNPAQFAPHEDFASYPRTLSSDLATLESLAPPESLAVVVPQVRDMYPSGITQDVAQQKGTFVSVDGFAHQMEGAARPTFFRGVATVVTKLFNLVQPDNAYFGQKDIQQALLLRRMVGDLLMTYPTPRTLHIIPTTRDTTTGLALSSRNAYLSEKERDFAPTLVSALRAGSTSPAPLATARGLVEERVRQGEEQGVHMRLDYVSLNDPDTFDSLTDEQYDAVRDAELTDGPGKPIILSGALWVGKTRLIDNIILGDTSSIIY
ncbi:Pantoate-beta-alanine ligase [Exidia glandulosa HHB12029]|uniref:Pantoate--beta-alanine ligase n=1 Tax=Exidia glandulosa HHB12029 TaxID=1314781 RepID=A0A165GTA5_EXIGL|nr:Pantoate-beta-alanine ligase [Exidia glandulosa HHB12029]